MSQPTLAPQSDKTKRWKFRKKSLRKDALATFLLFFTPPPPKKAFLLFNTSGNKRTCFSSPQRYDARGATKEKVDPSLPQPLEGRASFHLAEPSYLSLKSASLNDSGNYECRVDFLVKPSRTTFIKVKLILCSTFWQPQRKLNFSVFQKFILTGVALISLFFFTINF